MTRTISTEEASDALLDFYRRNERNRPTYAPRQSQVTTDSQSFGAGLPPKRDEPKEVHPVVNTLGIGPPIIDSFFPYWSSWRGGLTCDIRGSNFAPGCSVRFDGYDASSVTFINSQHIQAVTANNGLGDFSLVETPGVAVSNVTPFNSATSDTLCCFKYESNPSIASLQFSDGSEVFSGIGLGTGALGHLSAGVKLNFICYDFIPQPEFYAFTGTLYFRQSTDSGASWTGYSQGFVLNGVTSFTFNTGPGASIRFQVVPEPSFTPSVTFEWDYTT